MNYGYVRKSVSTSQVDATEQFEKEYRKLLDLGAQVIITDQFDLTERERPNLEDLIKNKLLSGDVLYLTKLGMLQDSISRAMVTVERILSKGASIYIDNIGIINKNPECLQYKMLSWIIDEERNMGIERSYEGKAIARKRGDFSDGRPKIPVELMDRAMELLKTKRMKDVVQITGISRSSLIREREARNIR